MKNIAINGFGRIGRAVFKIALEREDINVVAINDLGDIDNLAYLLSYDTIYGRYSSKVRVEKGNLVVGDKEIKILNEPNPEKLPWKKLGVDVVIESTGIFTDDEGSRKHIKAGAKLVLISAPSKSDSIPTVIVGVNDNDSAKKIVSNASCTTNCITPLVSVIDQAFGVKKAVLTTVHSYTSTQNIVDGPSKKDFRRGRSAAQNIVPSSTGAAIAATKAYPGIAGKFDGVALRVPTAIVSMADVTFVLNKRVTTEEVNKAFEEAENNSSYKGVLGTTRDPLVSSDFKGDPRSAIVDLSMTRVVDGDLVKVMAWYDNEWAYSNRLVEQAVELGD